MTEEILQEIKENFEKFLTPKFPDVKEPLVYYKFVGNNTAEQHHSPELYLWSRYNSILVNIPYITVKNSKNKIHLIEELWVLIVLDVNSELMDIYCCRSKMSHREYKVSYAFSHAERQYGNNFGYWRHLCFGRGDIANYISKLRYTNYSKSLYLPLPQTIWDYFSWESLEGGPYVRMSEIYEEAKVVFRADPCILCDFDNSCRGKALIREMIQNDLGKLLYKIHLSYKNGTFYFTQINLTQLHYNLYTILKEENDFTGIPDAPFVRYKGKLYETKCTLSSYSDNGVELTVASSTQIVAADNDRVMFSLPDGRVIKSKLYKEENDNLNKVKFLYYKFTIDVASMILRHLTPTNVKIC